MSSQKVSGAGGQNFFEKILDLLPTGNSSLGNSNQSIGQSRAAAALSFLIGQANDGTGASRFSAKGQQATGDARQISANSGFKSINLDDFLSVKKGSNSLAALVIGNAEGTRTPSGKFTRLYFGHTDPGDKKANIGSFSYNSSRGNGNATTPADADRVELQDLNRVKQSYENKVRAAGLDPHNALLAATFFDEHIQSPRSAERFLSPANLAYIKEHGINPQSVAEARFRSWINPETGNLYRTAKGNFSAGGFAQIARDRLNVRNPTEAQVQQVVRQDQGRRVGELVRALKAQGFADGSATQPTTQPTTPTTPTTIPTTTPTTNVLKRGSNGDAVKDLQNILVKLGQLSDAQMQTGVGIYGPKTQKAVESFQANVGLPVTGELDAPTQKAMSAVLSAISRGDEVDPALIKNVQKKLVDLGYLTTEQIGGGAGKFGPKTEAALKEFQSQNGIPSTGRFGPLTYKALFNSNPTAATTAPAKVDDNAPTVSANTLINPVTGRPGFNPKTDISADGGGDGHFHAPRGGGVHRGVDIKARLGDPVYAAHAGVVTKRSQEPGTGFGYYVDITNQKTGLTTRYAHLDKASWDKLQDGKTVKAGEAFAKVGRSGNVREGRGTHVHFEIRRGPGEFGGTGEVNPTDFLGGKPLTEINRNRG